MSCVHELIKKYAFERTKEKKSFNFNSLFYYLDKQEIKTNTIDINNGYKKTFTFDDDSFISFSIRFNNSLNITIVGNNKRTDIKYVNGKCIQRTDSKCDSFGRKI